MENTSSKIEIIVEKNDGVLWVRVEDKGSIIFTPYGDTIEMLKENFKGIICDLFST